MWPSLSDNSKIARKKMCISSEKKNIPRKELELRK
jgi:hypothetical protein